MSGELKFDNMTVKFEEAVTYMKQHHCTFKSIGYESIDLSINDLSNNKIICANYVRTEPTYNTELSKSPPGVLLDLSLSQKLNELVEDFKLRQSLLAEVDYVSRNRPIEQTLNCDLNLIMQNMMYISSSPQHKFYNSNVLIMRENSPLATLGFVAQLLCAHNEVIIESEANTAVLCHIFTTMCHKAGLTNVKLAFVKNSPPGDNDVTKLQELQYGCAAVVTGNGDIDSAVDSIIAAPNVYPWHLRRVFVQECVGKRFRQALEWKSKLEGKDAAGSKEYNVNGKLLLHECIGELTEGIVIEEYRTVKELLSLCKEKAPFAVSVWCSDVCEANEIAHGVPSTLVWVDGLWRMAGPPAASQAFYSILDTTFGSQLILAGKEPASDESWSKLTTFERRAYILDCVKRNEIKLDIPHVTDGSFAMVDRGLLCIGVQSPAGCVFCNEGWPLGEILRALIGGSTVFKSLRKSALYNALQDAGIPIHPVSGNSYRSMPSIYSMYRTKVVWTTFGTTFAN